MCRRVMGMGLVGRGLRSGMGLAVDGLNGAGWG